MPTGVSAALSDSDEYWMRETLALAERAAAEGEVPVGALVVRGGECLGRGWNRPIAARDPTAHAEINALRDAAVRVGNYRLPGATLYVTLEPCLMCSGALVHARIERLVFGAPDARRGAVCSHLDVFAQPWLNHRVAVTGGVLAEPAAELLRAFFRERRE